MNDEQKAELAAISDRPPVHTRRAVCEALEPMLYEVNPCLDHGFVRLIDYMGDEAAIVQAARVSYGAGTKAVSNDRGLIRYLVRHRHTTPLEMCEIKLHCKMPIFVARQWIRHRTANVNEASGRYSILLNEFYVPEPEHIGVQSSSNKQGRGETLTAEQAADVMKLLRVAAMQDYENYETLLNDDGNGNPDIPENPMVARELARMGLGLNFYTEWYWKIDLHNLLHFLSLRAHSHAQYEIRVFADVIAKMVEAWVPAAWEAFEDYHPHRGAHTFSKQEMELVRHLITEGPGYFGRDEMRRMADEFGLGSTRERKTFWQAAGLLKE
jgi:thymidylate synthase (FAD)